MLEKARIIGPSIDERESSILAPYAMLSRDSQGRRHAEPPHPYRGPFQRDRDRIVHSSAFRRLSGKMQVFTGEMGDYHRTRLTHSMEVASIARTIGRALRLNEDLIEALALLHDIGHPPYGHTGEQVLHECLVDHGGFSHNRFALTLVEDLEQRYPQFPGLNLSLELLEGQSTRVEKGGAGPAPLLEVQVVEAADSMTYNAHDLDDALKLSMVPFDELSQVPMVDGLIALLRPVATGSDAGMMRKTLVHSLIEYQVGDLVSCSSARLNAAGCGSAAEARQKGVLIGLGPALLQEKVGLESFLRERVYRHDRLRAIRKRVRNQMLWMFDCFGSHPEWLPPQFQQRARERGLRPVVGEYLAGMTDRFFQQQYRRHRLIRRQA